MANKGWVKGIVYEVIGGDTLIIASGTRSQAPEKRVTLSSLVAPRLGKWDGSTDDEEFAWESREFLRSLCIGSACTFRVDFAVGQNPGQDFGSVFVGPESINASLAVVREGWAKVSADHGPHSPYYKELKEAEGAAKAARKGVWCRDTNKIARKGYKPGHSYELLEQYGTERSLPAIVEQVLEGDYLRVVFLNVFVILPLKVAGIVAATNTGQQKMASKSGSDALGSKAVQDFTLEARHFTRTHVLKREVRVFLHGIDSLQNLLGSIAYFPSENLEMEAADLGVELVSKGLAKVAHSNSGLLNFSFNQLEEAQKMAVRNKIGLWQCLSSSHPPTKEAQFNGTVIEIVSGDTLSILDDATGKERRVTLSSIKSPRLGNRHRPYEPFSRKSKDSLRQLLIGKQVQVNVEYTRNMTPVAPDLTRTAASATERQMTFGSVHIWGKNDNKTQQTNVAAYQLEKGMVFLVKHRDNEDRSTHYETLLQAEQDGILKKAGLHCGKESGLQPERINDISVAGSASKARQYLPFLTRHKFSAVVEAVLSGNRIKLYVEKEGLMLAFSPSGVQTPLRPQHSGSVHTTDGEELYYEALAFTRLHFLQRQVDVQVTTVDRGGCFLGSLSLRGSAQLDMGIALLRKGLAKLHPNYNPVRESLGKDLVAAQSEAQQKRIKVWEKYVPPHEGPDSVNNANATLLAPKYSQVHIKVTDIVNAQQFYIQYVDEPRIGWIEERIKALNLKSQALLPEDMIVGADCLARFSADNQWYRAKIEAVEPSHSTLPYQVQFIDYGNREKVDGGAIKQIDAALAAVPPQAHLASLAYIKVNDMSDDFGIEAARMLGKLTASAAQRPAIRCNSSSQLLILGPDGDVERSINAQLLSMGLAKLTTGHSQDDVIFKELISVEDAARREHTGLWRYGDPGSDSDDASS